jgi:hypothetical protein
MTRGEFEKIQVATTRQEQPIIANVLLTEARFMRVFPFTEVLELIEISASLEERMQLTPFTLITPNKSV